MRRGRGRSVSVTAAIGCSSHRESGTRPRRAPASGIVSGSRERSADTVIPTTAPESSSMCSIRSAGYLGSTGTNAAPDLATASIDSDRLDRAGHAQRHKVFRADAAVGEDAQPAGSSARPVRDTSSRRRDWRGRHPRDVTRAAGGEEFGQRAFRAARRPTSRNEGGAFGVGEDVDVADADPRVGRSTVSRIRRSRIPSRVTVAGSNRSMANPSVAVMPDGLPSASKCSAAVTRRSNLPSPVVSGPLAALEQHLDDRRERRGIADLEYPRQLIEGNVAVLERLLRDLVNAAEEIGEGLVRIDALRSTTMFWASHRSGGASGHVPSTAAGVPTATSGDAPEPAQQNGQGRVQNREGGGAVFAVPARATLRWVCGTDREFDAVRPAVTVRRVEPGRTARSAVRAGPRAVSVQYSSCRASSRRRSPSRAGRLVDRVRARACGSADDELFQQFDELPVVQSQRRILGTGSDSPGNRRRVRPACRSGTR